MTPASWYRAAGAALVVAAVAGDPAAGVAPVADDAAKLLAAYRKIDFAPGKGKVDDTWRRRLSLEFRLIHAGRPAPLRSALSDRNKHVRAFAASALGILGDRGSVPALAGLVADDPEPMVRCQALQALGWLRNGAEAIKRAMGDENRDVRFMAAVAAAHLKDPAPHAAEVRRAHSPPLKPEEMGIAKVGSRAPDFTLAEPGGAPVRLSRLLGKGPVVLLFQLADW